MIYFNDHLFSAKLEENPRQLTREIAGRVNGSQPTVNRHLVELGKVSKLGLLVRYNLSERNKGDRMLIIASVLSRIENHWQKAVSC